MWDTYQNALEHNEIRDRQNAHIVKLKKELGIKKRGANATKEQLLKLQDELNKIQSNSLQSSQTKEEFECQLAQETKEKIQGEQVVEETSKVQHDLESRININEEKIQSLTRKVKTSEEENCTLQHQLSEFEVEIERLRNANLH